MNHLRHKYLATYKKNDISFKKTKMGLAWSSSNEHTHFKNELKTLLDESVDVYDIYRRFSRELVTSRDTLRFKESLLNELLKLVSKLDDAANDQHILDSEHRHAIADYSNKLKLQIKRISSINTQLTEEERFDFSELLLRSNDLKDFIAYLEKRIDELKCDRVQATENQKSKKIHLPIILYLYF